MRSDKAVICSASRRTAPPKTPITCLRMPSVKRPRPDLCFDLGAESGRAVLGRLQSGVLTIEEIHRFPNEAVEYGGSLHWDVARLWLEVRKALACVGQLTLRGIGVDAW